MGCRRGESISSGSDGGGRRSRRDGSRDGFGRSKRRRRESNRDSGASEARRPAAAVTLSADMSRPSGPSIAQVPADLVTAHLRVVPDSVGYFDGETLDQVPAGVRLVSSEETRRTPKSSLS